MRILAVGDIVGRTGLKTLKEVLPKVVKENNIDFIIVNGENAADGMGITEKMYKSTYGRNSPKPTDILKRRHIRNITVQSSFCSFCFGR